MSRIKSLYTFIIVVFLSTYTTFAQEVSIVVSDTAYAGKEITFAKYHNQITYQEETLATGVFDEKGNLEISFRLEQPAYVFTRLGVYFAYLFAEPGKSYVLAFPPKQEKTMEDKLNPYFEEVFIQLADLEMEEENLNFKIRMFNNTYNSLFSKYVLASSDKKTFENIDEDIEKTEKPFKNSDNAYFNNYRYYKYGFLKNTALQQKSTGSFIEYFKGKPVLYENTAYMDFFNQIFGQYFQQLGRTKTGADLYQNINTEKSYKNLLKTLQKEHAIKNDELMEMVVLKNLHDEFYNDKFSRSAMLVVLDSLVNQTAYPKNKEIGQQIKHKVTKLLAGYAPPKFQLYNMDSVLVTLDDFKGEYVYLNFCTANSYACLSEYEMIKNLYQRLNEHLKVVTISNDPTYSEMKEFVEKRGYEWTFLHVGNQPEVIKDYDIRTFPTYYLVDKEGKLVLSPAPSPREQFEGSLFKIMRSRGDI